MKKMKRLLLSLLVVAMSMAVMGQGDLVGTIIDEDSETGLPGANIVEVGTTNGTITNAEGNFTLVTTSRSGEIVISFMGYESQNIPFDLSSAGGLGEIILSVDANTMEEVVVTGYGVIDVAKDRETPVAVSTIKLPEIIAKTGNQELYHEKYSRCICGQSGRRLWRLTYQYPWFRSGEPGTAV